MANAVRTGRADSEVEKPFETARREAYEEIGLPNDIGDSLPRPLLVEHLCELPANLARSEIVVRPCVAFLHSFDETTGQNVDPEEILIPTLDPREVASVFTVPFHNFLSARDSNDPNKKPDDWYVGSWMDWHGYPWRRKSGLLVACTVCKCMDGLDAN